MRTPSIVKSALLIATLGLAAQAHAVVESGHWGLSSTTLGDAPLLQFDIDQTTQGDYTSILSSYANGVLKGETYALDQGADLFVVQKGAIFSNDTVLSQNLTFLHGVSFESGWSPGSATVGQEFYLGARTRTSHVPGYFDTFGWAHFKVDSLGQLQLLDSAVAFNEGGIIVGTLQAVPEPSTIALMSVGLGLVAWRSRRQSVKSQG